MLTKLKQALQDLHDMRRLPQLEICLQREDAVGNDPFFLRLVDDFYASSTKPHPKFPVIKAFELGVAVCVLPPTFDDYFMAIESSARRNHRKAVRLGYTFERLDFNRHLDDLRAIHQSTDVRQGKVSHEVLYEQVKPCHDPASLTTIHDYAFFGILRDGHVWAYASVFIAGEYAQIETILGHAEHQPDGIVPMLIIEIVRHLREHFPQVRCFAYDTYFGAGETLRRFKRKFGFVPYRVTWKL